MQIFLRKIRHYTMAFTHKYTQIYPGKPEGKNQLSWSFTRSLFFLSLHYIKCLQYNIRFQRTSETLNSNIRIRKPLTEKPNTMDYKTAYHNTTKNNSKKKNSKAPHPNPRICVADNGFGANALKIDKGGPSGLPPSAV